MSEISRAETGPSHERSSLDPRRIGEMILDGIMSIKDAANEKRGEMVPGLFSFLSPVPKEFNIQPFKLKPDPIIKIKT